MPLLIGESFMDHPYSFGSDYIAFVCENDNDGTVDPETLAFRGVSGMVVGFKI